MSDMSTTETNILRFLGAAGGLSASTAVSVDDLEMAPALAGVDLDEVLDRMTTAGTLGMSSTGADDSYWIS